MDSDSILNSHAKSAFKELSDLLNNPKFDSKVAVISAIRSSDNCAESYPCHHYDGDLELIFENGKSMSVKLSSVGTGYIQYYFFPKIETHFTEYVSKESRATINKIRK